MKLNREGKATALNRAGMEALIAELEGPYKLAVGIAYYCAERMGAVVQVKVENIKGGDIAFPSETTKTKTFKTARICPQLAALLTEYKTPVSGYLFPSSSKAGHLTTRAVENKIKAAASVLGFEGVTTHTPRRSMATYLSEQGWPLAKIAKITGHESLAMLERYIDSDKQKACDDLANLFS